MEHRIPQEIIGLSNQPLVQRKFIPKFGCSVADIEFLRVCDAVVRKRKIIDYSLCLSLPPDVVADWFQIENMKVKNKT